MSDETTLERCKQDTLCTLPSGNHEQHYDCRDGLLWPNYAYEPPVSVPEATPAERDAWYEERNEEAPGPATVVSSPGADRPDEVWEAEVLTERQRRFITAGLEAGMLVEVEFTWGTARGVLVAPSALPKSSRLLRFEDGPIVRAVSGGTMPTVVSVTALAASVRSGEQQ